MINKCFENIFPFAYNYFSTLLDLIKEEKRRFPQAIIFEGIDTQKQYLFAMELARVLNCKEDKTQNCECVNCSWIKSLAHPAVQNVSQIHFKGEDDETKTIISTKQAREIEKSLLLSSDYYRFFIFFSSKEKDYDCEMIEFKKMGYNAQIDYSIEPLSNATFHKTTLNALLKSVEEPPENTTFVFLTKSKEDILPTIVSRCLVFKLGAGQVKLNYQAILDIISNYPNFDIKNIYEIAENIHKFIADNQISLEEFLNLFLEYLKDLLVTNSTNARLCEKINADIKMISYAIKQARANIQPKIVVEVLLLRLLRGF